MRDTNRQRKTGNSSANSALNVNQSPTGSKRVGRDKNKATKGKNVKVSGEKRERESERETRKQGVSAKSSSKSKERKRQQGSHADKDSALSLPRGKKKERLVEGTCASMSDRKNAENSPRNVDDGLGGARKEDGVGGQRDRMDRKDRKERRDRKDRKDRKEDASRSRRADRVHDDDHEGGNQGQPSMESILRSLVQQGHPGSFGGSQVFFGHPFHAGSSSHQRDKINSLIDMIENDGNPGEQLTGLSELCEHVSIASEESMLSFPTDRVVPLLIEELQGSSNPDVMLLAARAVTLLLDVYPPSARVVNRCGGVGVFCEKLLSIEYIDLAEQSIQALGKMSESYPELLLDASQGNVLDAVLSFLDFFQIGMQRIAVATAANVCRAMASDGGFWTSSMSPRGADADQCSNPDDGPLGTLKMMFRGSIPVLLQLTVSADNKIALSAYQALSSIARTCGVVGLPVESVIDIESLQVVLERLIGAGATASQMKPCVFYAMVRFVCTSTSTSVELPKKLLELQVPCVMANILALLSTKAQSAGIGSTTAGVTSLQELKPRNQEETFLLISLVDGMLPPVLASDLRVFDRSKTKREMKTLAKEGIVVRNEEALRASSVKNLVSIREELLKDGGCAPMDAISPVLLDSLLHLEFATLSRDSKLAVLSLVDKIIFYSSPACLVRLVAELPLSVFIIRLLQSSNHVWPLSGLKFIASLMQKQPELKRSLMREGILHEVKKTKGTFLDLGLAEKDLSAAFSWLAERVLVCCFGEHSNTPDGSAPGGHETEGIVALQKIRSSIAASAGDNAQALHALGDFLKLVLEREVSPYEIHASGILEDVHLYLNGGEDGVDTSLSQRRASFLDMVGSSEARERVIDTIQEILMNSEHLQVINSMTGAVPSLQSMLLGNLGLASRTFGAQDDSRDDDPFSNGLKALGTPVRIKLRCMDDILHDSLTGTAILIEPLATVAQTQEYLKPKIARLLTSRTLSELKASRGQEEGGGEPIATRSRSKRLGYLPGMGKGMRKGDEHNKGASGSGQKSDDSDQPSPQSPAADEVDLVHDDMEVLEEFSESDVDEDVDMIDEEDTSAEADMDEDGAQGCQKDDKRARDGGPAGRTRGANARGAGVEPTEFSIRLFYGGKELDPTDTLLRLVHSEKLSSSPQNSHVDMAHVWEDTHQIDFCIDPVSCAPIEAGKDSSAPMDADCKLEDILCDGAVSESSSDCQVYYAVRVLQVFEDVISQDQRSLLVNSKICSKLIKQMKDPLLVCSRTLPSWCSKLPRLAKFLFSYESRHMYFRYHAFGLGRTMLAMLEDASRRGGSVAGQDAVELPFRMPRILRQKVRISRSHVLESSRKVFERYADTKSRLEVEFYNEAGSGLGPTLEFYTLLSTEFQRRDLAMWRESDISSSRSPDVMMDELPGPKAGELPFSKRAKELVVCPLGLFPKPLLDGKDSAAVLNNFKLLGKVAAKAIQDNRLLDIPLSRPFYKIALNGPGSLERVDLRDIDPAVFRTISEIQQAAMDARESDSSTVMLKGVPIDDLCLSFVLPGDDNYELCPNGRDVPVTSQNASSYVDSVFDALLDTGIRAQMAAFKQGFEKIFPLEHLRVFYEDEVESILCGDSNEAWTHESLAAAITCDHGYSSSSPPVVALINVLVDLDPIDKRRFLKFVTGAPRLPAGGLASLKPKLTVVRKNPDVPNSASIKFNGSHEADAELMSPKSKEQMVAMYADRDLPSVMTCANYLKLPPYSTVDVLRERLLFSIREGQNSFDLS